MGNHHSSKDVQFKELIGSGSYGEVYKGTWQGKQVALKKLHNVLFNAQEFSIRGEVFNNLSKEWDILSRLSHPNIVQYYTVILDDRRPPILVFELCKTDLNHFIKESNGKVPFQNVVNIMSDVAEGLVYLHNSHADPIIHRDLASKNVLLTEKLQAKITDFGISKVFPHGAMYATAGVGTMVYAAPETWPEKQGRGRFADKAYYTEKVDIFSFGAMLLEVVIGRLPIGPLPDPLLEGKLN